MPRACAWSRKLTRLLVRARHVQGCWRRHWWKTTTCASNCRLCMIGSHALSRIQRRRHQWKLGHSRRRQRHTNKTWPLRLARAPLLLSLAPSPSLLLVPRLLPRPRCSPPRAPPDGPWLPEPPPAHPRDAGAPCSLVECCTLLRVLPLLCRASSPVWDVGLTGRCEVCARGQGTKIVGTKRPLDE